MEIKLYLGTEFIGDIAAIAKNRQLMEQLKSEHEDPEADTFSCEVNWAQLERLTRRRFDEPTYDLLRVGKTHVVVKTDGYVRFSGFLASRPAREGFGRDQVVSLVFYEHFARLSGDVVCAADAPTSPMWRIHDRPADEFVRRLIQEFLARAEKAGDVIRWRFGEVAELGNKTITYKDFPTIAKALCDAMNNTQGAGKFDVVIRTDPDDDTRQIIDVLHPRGTVKNIIIKYPSDGVYALWSTDWAVEETNNYASHILVSGNGQVGDVEAGEQTAAVVEATNAAFVKDYCYWRTYETASNLFSEKAVGEFAKKRIDQLDFRQETPTISLVGRPIAWGQAENLHNGLAVGDSFYFHDENDDGVDTSGWMRIIAMETEWDDVGVATVQPTLRRTVIDEDEESE